MEEIEKKVRAHYELAGEEQQEESQEKEKPEKEKPSAKKGKEEKKSGAVPETLGDIPSAESEAKA